MLPENPVCPLRCAPLALPRKPAKPSLVNVPQPSPALQVKREYKDAKTILMDKALYADLWEDAQMGSVVAYLRGAQTLSLPEEWKAAFPKSLPPE